MDLRADMNAAFRKEFLLRFGIKHQPTNRYEVTNYSNTEKKKIQSVVEMPEKKMGGRKELLNK